MRQAKKLGKLFPRLSNHRTVRKHQKKTIASKVISHKTLIHGETLRRNVHAEKNLYDKNPTIKIPYSEVSSRQNFLTAKSPSAKCPTAKNPTLKNLSTISRYLLISAVCYSITECCSTLSSIGVFQQLYRCSLGVSSRLARSRGLLLPE